MDERRRSGCMINGEKMCCTLYAGDEVYGFRGIALAIC